MLESSSCRRSSLREGCWPAFGFDCFGEDFGFGDFGLDFGFGSASSGRARFPSPFDSRFDC